MLFTDILTKRTLPEAKTYKKCQLQHIFPTLLVFLQGDSSLWYGDSRFLCHAISVISSYLTVAPVFSDWKYK